MTLHILGSLHAFYQISIKTLDTRCSSVTFSRHVREDSTFHGRLPDASARNGFTVSVTVTTTNHSQDKLTEFQLVICMNCLLAMVK